MALILTEGFGWSNTVTDFSTYGPWQPTPFSAIATNGPLGDNFANTYNNNWAYLSLPSSYTNLFLGCRLNFQNQNSEFSLQFQDATNSPACYVNVFQNGTVNAYDKSNSLLVSSSSSSITASNWFYAEFGLVVGSGSSGSITVKINGTQVVTATGNLIPSTNVVQQIAMRNPSNGYLSIAHLYVCDNTTTTNNSFLGDVRVQTLFPASNHSVTFTANGLANNWQNAAKTPISTADYNYANTANASDSFNYQSMASNLGQIYAVNVKSIVAKSDAGARTVANQINGVSGTAFSPGVSGKQFETIFANNPSGGTWTVSTVDGLNAGYTIVT